MVPLQDNFNLQKNSNNYKTISPLENPFRTCIVRHVTKKEKEKGKKKKKEKRSKRCLSHCSGLKWII